jgi:NDP-sugar pyrophosphorylase family protein
VFDPVVLKYLRPEAYLNFPDLVTKRIDSQDKVLIYPYDGIWYDVVSLEDFNRVHEVWHDLKDKILGNND